MLKIFTISLFALFAATDIQQAMPEQEGMNDPKAKEILDKVSATFKNSNGIRATFSQTIEMPGGKTSTKQGKVLVKGDMYRVELDDQHIYCDRQSVWTYLIENNEVQINNYEPDPSDISPSGIFNIYQNDFYYMKEADETISGVLCNVIELTPKDKSRPYFKVRLWIDKKTNTAKKVKIFDKNGYRYTYVIKTVDVRAGLEDSIFRFNKTDYPGVKIEDLRM